MSKANKLDWKTYESITKYIYETLGKQSGVTIKGYGSDCKVKGKSGVSLKLMLLHLIQMETRPMKLQLNANIGRRR